VRARVVPPGPPAVNLLKGFSYLKINTTVLFHMIQCENLSMVNENFTEILNFLNFQLQFIELWIDLWHGFSLNTLAKL
jgi:hypothetical protein